MVPVGIAQSEFRRCGGKNGELGMYKVAMDVQIISVQPAAGLRCCSFCPAL